VLPALFFGQQRPKRKKNVMPAEVKAKTTTQQELDKQKALMAAKAGQGFSVAGIGQFLKETWVELMKTTWPDRNTLTKSTYIVLAFIGAAAVWVGVLDHALTIAIRRLLNID
jgi:preprotein translocase SecE subunit